MTPNLTHLKLWVEDLESGKHNQVRNFMGRKENNMTSYCCLGRLCEVAIDNDVAIHRRSIVARNTTVSRKSTMTNQCVLMIGYSGEFGSYVPTTVGDWVGIAPAILAVYAGLNDMGKTFAEIAKRVREDYGLSAQAS